MKSVDCDEKTCYLGVFTRFHLTSCTSSSDIKPIERKLDYVGSVHEIAKLHLGSIKCVIFE